MAARGAAEKQSVMATILSTFSDAFEYDKTIRIPVGDVQIKVTLACAKDNVEPGGDTALPGTKVATGQASEGSFEFATEQTSIKEPTQEEMDNVTDFMTALNL